MTNDAQSLHQAKIMLETQAAEIERLRAAMQWRPISGPLPKEFKRFLATDGEVCGEAWRHAARFYWVDDSAADSITHWMPLPPPPAGETNE